LKQQNNYSFTPWWRGLCSGIVSACQRAMRSWDRILPGKGWYIYIYIWRERERERERERDIELKLSFFVQHGHSAWYQVVHMHKNDWIGNSEEMPTRGIACRVRFPGGKVGDNTIIFGILWSEKTRETVFKQRVPELRIRNIRKAKIFHGLAFRVSEVQFGNFSL
jgi:hypothetical protein